MILTLLTLLLCADHQSTSRRDLADTPFCASGFGPGFQNPEPAAVAHPLLSLLLLHTRIYLENRQSLELENRGGAQANVDEVNILEINQVAAHRDRGFTSDATWTVSGSVNHFGHTHYRRNKYHALVTFTVDEESWKITDIELIDEKRLL